MVRVGAGTHVDQQMDSWEKLLEGWVWGQTVSVTACHARRNLFTRLESAGYMGHYSMAYGSTEQRIEYRDYLCKLVTPG